MCILLVLGCSSHCLQRAESLSFLMLAQLVLTDTLPIVESYCIRIKCVAVDSWHWVLWHSESKHCSRPPPQLGTKLCFQFVFHSLQSQGMLSTLIHSLPFPDHSIRFNWLLGSFLSAELSFFSYTSCDPCLSIGKQGGGLVQVIGHTLSALGFILW